MEVVPAKLGVEAVLAVELLDTVEHLDLLRETGTAADMLTLRPQGRSPPGSFTASDVVASTTIRWERRWGANMGGRIVGLQAMCKRTLAS
mmetsp:Transcript_45994/g.116951  ORF Transcript_45994/g.116951 Transcript_45994/m.116951 type:complete len:90 (+) Transcript_45994:77-346(+)